MASSRPLIVGIGGGIAPGSSTELALATSLAAAEIAGAETQLFGGGFLARLPHYRLQALASVPEAQQLIAAVRRADGVVIASPGYHGSISGLVKNALDYLEETARDGRPYLSGMPVGLIATAWGWQATGSTLAALRSIVHALRGWPTPLGAAINTSGGTFDGGRCADEHARSQLQLVGEQVVAFTRAGASPAAVA